MVIKRRVVCVVCYYVALLLLLLAASAKGEVTRDRVLFYDFSEGTGTVVHDKSGKTPLINLTIPDPAKVEWISGGLRVKEATLLKTSALLTKLAASNFSSGFTVEAWVRPANATQSGPARIVTFSADSGNRNFTLGQSGSTYDVRFRTSENPGNGTDPSTRSPAGSIATTPDTQHVVYTRTANGNAKLYIDKVEVATESVPGDLSNWDESYGFGLFNETDYPINVRTWLGEIYSVAIYATVLTPEEIAANYGGIQVGSVTLAWDANTESNIAGYKIYYGTTSRYAPEVAEKIPAVITENCNLLDSGELSPSQQSCKESWEKWCTCSKWGYNNEEPPVLVCLDRPDPPDPACDSDYYPYDRSVDVKNVTEYTLTDLIIGVTYYLAATAYDDKYPAPHHESKFSIELTHTVRSGITKVINLRQVPLIREN